LFIELNIFECDICAGRYIQKYLSRRRLQVLKIRILIGDLSIDAELNDTPTALKLLSVLPLSSSFNTWGDEIYFEVPVEADLDESAKIEVEIGDLGYWPQGKAFCVFFGPTPISPSGKILPASKVNIIGKISGDPLKFKQVINESEIRIEVANDI
jgi:hypothetical protein